MKTETTYNIEYNSFQLHLYIAIELSNTEWKLGFTIGYGQKPRVRTVHARDLEALQREIKTAKKRFDLAEDAPVLSCYEARERGISKEGNTFVRSMAIQIAWGWLRHQPESKLSYWYQKRFGHGSKRLRKIDIVALARRLLIDLWRYLETGLVPEGAELKTRLF